MIAASRLVVVLLYDNTLVPTWCKFDSVLVPLEACIWCTYWYLFVVVVGVVVVVVVVVIVVVVVVVVMYVR
jgi:hypothetical protein